MYNRENFKTHDLMKKLLAFGNQKISMSLRWSWLIFLAFSVGGLQAQGWQQIISSAQPTEAWSVIEAVDGGYLVLGQGMDPAGDLDQDAYIVKLDIDGTVVWTKYYDNGGMQIPRAMAQTADGNYIIVGSIEGEGDSTQPDVYLLKVDGRGNQIWSRTYGGDVTEVANSVKALADGGFIIAGESDAGPSAESDILIIRFDEFGSARWQKTYGTDRSDVGNGITLLGAGFALVGNSKNDEGFDNDILVYYLDDSGELVWEKRLSNDFTEEGRAIVATKDGGIAIAGLINNQPDAFIAKLDASGNLRWSRTLGGVNTEEEANALTELEDGSLVLAGIQVQENGINVDIFLAKLAADGSLLWERALGRADYLDEVRAIVPTLDGGFALAGYNSPGLTFSNEVVLVKTDALGNTLTNVITGQVYHDADSECDFDAGERSLKNWLVVAVGAEQTFYGTTNENGTYNITVDTGVYIVDIVPENRYWDRCQENGYPIRFSNFYDTLTVDMAAVSEVNCPYLEIDISAPYLVRCDNVVYTVEYCNLGTSDANDSRIEVLLDNQLTFLESAKPSTQEAGKLIFDIGDVPAGECGSFQFIAQAACTGIAKNQAVLVEAVIYPDTSCLEISPGWDRSDIRIVGSCEAEELLFRVSNIGSKMEVQRSLVVIEADIILNVGQYRLNQLSDTLIRIPADQGTTYRVIADQAEDHPFKAFATAVVEGCANDGAFPTGFVTQFPEDDDEPNRAKDVQEIIDSIPSVELRGYPKGYKNGIIAQQTDLTYKFLLSNQGADTLDRIVIRDTLSEYLDLSTLQMGASSHPYSFEVYNEGILKITFDDIQLLPDGAVDDSEIVYVEFKISQLADNPAGTEIRNRASIFFENQVPLLSNEIIHRVEQYPGFVEVVVDTKSEYIPGVELRVYPNPFSDQVRFTLSGQNNNLGTLRFSVFDLQGRQIDTQNFSGNQFDYFRHPALRSGVYVFRLETADNRLVSTGKLLVK